MTQTTSVGDDGTQTTATVHVTAVTTIVYPFRNPYQGSTSTTAPAEQTTVATSTSTTTSPTLPATTVSTFVAQAEPLAAPQADPASGDDPSGAGALVLLIGPLVAGGAWAVARRVHGSASP